MADLPDDFSGTVEKVVDFMQLYVDEDDRTAIILVGAKMEYLLGQAIASKLLPCVNENDELLDNDRALGSFSARIHAAYRLGIIDKTCAKALHIFRKIRNDFAHSYHDVSFNSGVHRDRLRELINPHINGEFYVNVKTFLQGKDIASEERIHFLMASGLLIMLLERAQDVVETISDRGALQYA